MLAIINAQNLAGNTALHWAALNGHLDSVKVLLEQGGDPTITNQRGHDAVYEAELNDKQEVVEWVLKEGGEGLEEVVSGETADAAEEDNADADTAIDEDGGRTDENSNKLEHDLKDMNIQDNATSH
jgi:ankyrin repeat protein